MPNYINFSIVMYFLLGLGTVTVTAYDGFFTFLTFIDEIRCGRAYPLVKENRSPSEKC